MPDLVQDMLRKQTGFKTTKPAAYMAVIKNITNMTTLRDRITVQTNTRTLNKEKKLT